MEIVVNRRRFLEDRTIGDMFIDGHLYCQTLEDKVRTGEKVYGKTAIPAGKYEVRLTYSNRFKVVMPQLMNVPGFEGIRIHSGNKPEHTEGCLLVGRKKGVDSISESVLAFETLFPAIRKMVGEGHLFIDIQGGIEAKDWKAA